LSPRLAGLLLFSPVPVVLALFTRLPLGVPASLALGVAIMVTHRAYARPFAVARASRQCLWCAGPVAAQAAVVAVTDPLGRVDWRVCSEAHARRVRGTLAWAKRHAVLLKAGVLGGLALFLPGTVAAHFGALGPLRPEDAVAFFRGAVGLAVAPLGWRGPSADPSVEETVPAPFPMHIQALIGMAAVTWLFRVVGPAWLVLAAAHAVTR
jgi:hypothetical protein